MQQGPKSTVLRNLGFLQSASVQQLKNELKKGVGKSGKKTQVIVHVMMKDSMDLPERSLPSSGPQN